MAEQHDLAGAICALGQELASEHPEGRLPVLVVHVRGASQALHPVVRDAVFGIAGEALRNAFHHADAKQIEVELCHHRRQLRLRVRDDGKGIDPELLRLGRGRHFGLRGMSEHAVRLGGKLAVWSRLDAGTEVELSIPGSHAYAPRPSRSVWLARKVRRQTQAIEW
ncbi:MAG TPA: ATP-binding protein [Caldimonas sp.]